MGEKLRTLLVDSMALAHPEYGAFEQTILLWLRKGAQGLLSTKISRIGFDNIRHRNMKTEGYYSPALCELDAAFVLPRCFEITVAVQFQSDYVPSG